MKFSKLLCPHKLARSPPFLKSTRFHWFYKLLCSFSVLFILPLPPFSPDLLSLLLLALLWAPAAHQSSWHHPGSPAAWLPLELVSRNTCRSSEYGQARVFLLHPLLPDFRGPHPHHDYNFHQAIPPSRNSIISLLPLALEVVTVFYCYWFLGTSSPLVYFFNHAYSMTTML